MKDVPKRYKPTEQEPIVQEFWDENDVYAFDPQESQKVFSIDTPPPTLSGDMHLGHAFSYSQGDFIARYRRMRGDAVLYPFGTDDNGLPTERLIEKQEGVRLQDMGRKEFISLVESSVAKQQPEFMKAWKQIGIAADFKNAYSTISKHSIKTSQKSFLDLYDKGLVKREESPISWCSTCQTAIAQAEFESVDKRGYMNTIIFETDEGVEFEVMTTRPELIPACVAVAAHPEDERYKDLAGHEIIIPLSERFDGPHTVSLIYDESVDPEKGTGLMMVCTFGDKEDVEKWRSHELDSKFIITEDGTLTNAGLYSGLSIEKARETIIEDLKHADLLISQEAITRPVNTHERCGTPLEFVHTTQWFVNVLDYKQELLEAGRTINWYPDFMRKRFEHWVENLGWDWCISRQRPYGIPFPVWYDEDGNVVVASEDQLPVDPSTDLPTGHDDKKLSAELDVMDTWATSSLTPQIVLDWADDESSFSEHFPMSLRLQAHDIIRTWAFYTITKAHLHHETIPWKDIVISGHALDPHGKKMSKSKGNAIDPQEMTQKYGADAVRFWAAGTKLGEDLPFQEKDLVTAKKLITKLWNASKFAAMHLKDFTQQEPESLELTDRWLLHKFRLVVNQATESFDEYEYSKTKSVIDQFFWNDFCDDYLELAKNRLYNPDDRGEDARLSAQYTLYTVLLGQLKLLAPIMPHVTEKIYQLYFRDSVQETSIHMTRWPELGDEFVDEQAFEAGQLLAEFLAESRKFKSDNQLSMRAEISHASLRVPEGLQGVVEDNILDFLSTSGVVEFDLSVGEPSIEFSLTQ